MKATFAIGVMLLTTFLVSVRVSALCIMCGNSGTGGGCVALPEGCSNYPSDPNITCFSAGPTMFQPDSYISNDGKSNIYFIVEGDKITPLVSSDEMVDFLKKRSAKYPPAKQRDPKIKTLIAVEWAAFIKAPTNSQRACLKRLLRNLALKSA